MHKLYFADTEKRAFLERRGYIIIDEMCETDIFIHGSRFITETYVDTIAIRGDEARPLAEAFEDELKTAILAL